MTTMTIAVLSFLIGVIAGLRSMTAPAAVAWGGHLGRLHLGGTALGLLGSTVAAWVLAALALVELIGDKLPTTPSRRRPGPFAARILTGALSGAAITVGTGSSLAPGALFGALGAVAGTLGGYAARTRLVTALGVPDYIVALVEDVIAVAGAVLIVATAGRSAVG